MLQISYSANLICLLGRQVALPRYPPSSKSLSASLREAGLLSRLPIVASAAVALLVGVSFHQWSIATILLSATFFIKLSSGVFNNMQRAAAISALSGRPFLYATVASQALLIIGAVVLTSIPVREPAVWLLVYGLSSLFPFLITSLVTSRNRSVHIRSRNDIRAISKFGLRFLPASLFQATIAQADRFLLPLLASFAQLGVYSVVVSMTELFVWPAKHWVESRVAFWRVANEKNRFRWGRDLIRVLIMTGAFSLPLALTIYFLLVPVFGAQYESGRGLVLPLTLAVFLRCVVIFGVNVGVATGWSKRVTSVSAINLVVGTSAMILLIPAQGSSGAAWGMVIGNGFGAVATLFILRGMNRPEAAHAAQLHKEQKAGLP